MSGKTYRVPKKVNEAARSALSQVGVTDLDADQSVRIGHALASGVPVGQGVLFAIRDFFFEQVRQSPTSTQALLHGGSGGKEWANRCITLTVAAPEKTGEPVADAPFEDLFALSDAEVDALIKFTNELAEAAGVETTAPAESDAELAVQELGGDEDGEEEEGETSATEELGEHVETALGLATQLDETIEKLADALDEALQETEDEEPVDPEAEAFEMSMVHDALAEVGAEVDAIDADFAVMAAEARERMAEATLVKRRSLAMARMASSRITLQAEGGPIAEAVEEKVAGTPADEDPKALGPDHHSKRQVRDWHGRFAKAGARVRSKTGNMGYIKKVDDQGQLVITDDEGNEHTVDPKEIEVISKKSPARLPQPMELVEDPKARLDSYLEWSRDQMGVGA